MLAFVGAAAGALELAVEEVARPAERSRVEDAWCATDPDGTVRVLAATDRGIEAWSTASPDWQVVVDGARHTGHLSGVTGAAFARWVTGAEPPAEAGAVSMDGRVLFREPLPHLSNTTTELAAWMSGDTVGLAMKMHTESEVRIAEGQPPLRIFESARSMGPVRADPAILQFSPDGSLVLVAGNGALYVIEVTTDELRQIDSARDQRAARLGDRGRAVVYSIPDGDRTRLAKADARTGRRIWLSDPVVEGETWGVQALDHLASVDTWIGVVDDRIVAIRDRDGRRLVLAGDPALPESQWSGYGQLTDWYRPPTVVTACSDETLLIGNLGGQLEILRIERVR